MDNVENLCNSVDLIAVLIHVRLFLASSIRRIEARVETRTSPLPTESSRLEHVEQSEDGHSLVTCIGYAGRLFNDRNRSPKPSPPLALSTTCLPTKCLSALTSWSSLTAFSVALSVRSLPASRRRYDYASSKPGAKPLMHRTLRKHLIFSFQGYKLVAMKMLVPSVPLLEQHYSDLKGKGFFPGLIKFMTSGPVVAMVCAVFRACRVAHRVA